MSFPVVRRLLCVVTSLAVLSPAVSRGAPVNLDVSRNAESLDWLRITRATVTHDEKAAAWFLGIEALTVTNGSDGKTLKEKADEILVSLEPLEEPLTSSDVVRLKMKTLRPRPHDGDGIIRTRSRVVLTSASHMTIKARIRLPALRGGPRPQRLQLLTTDRDHSGNTIALELLWEPTAKSWRLVYGPIGDVPEPSEGVIEIKGFATLNPAFSLTSTSLGSGTRPPDRWSRPGTPPVPFTYLVLAGRLDGQSCSGAEPLSLGGASTAIQYFESRFHRVAFVQLWKSQASDGAIDPFGTLCTTAAGASREVTLNLEYPFEPSFRETLATFVMFGILGKRTLPAGKFGWATFEARRKDGPWALKQQEEKYSPIFFPPYFP